MIDIRALAIEGICQAVRDLPDYAPLTIRETEVLVYSRSGGWSLRFIVHDDGRVVAEECYPHRSLNDTLDVLNVYDSRFFALVGQVAGRFLSKRS